MNNNFEYTAEAYLQGKLTAQEASQFEQGLAADPNLKEEFEFQKSIIEGVRSYRKAELKSYLNSIPVTSGFMKPIQMAAILAAASVVGGLLLIFVQVNKRFTAKSDLAAPVENVVKPSNTSIIPAETSAPEIESYDPKPSATVPKEMVVKESVKPILAASNKSSAVNKEINRIKPEAKTLLNSAKPSKEENLTRVSVEPDMVAANDFESKGVNIPEGEVSASAMDKKTQIGVTLADALNKGSLHYQYFNSKLYLYGNFDKSTYELIEMYANKKKNLYMYFNNEFYEIEQNRLEISEMNPIQNKGLVSELKKLIRVN